MAIHFFPKVIKFFNLFRQQNDILVETAGILNELFADYTNVSEKCSKIVQNEYAGNDISIEIARQLSLTFITPIDREDIHAINLAQENVLNSFRAISTRIGLYHFTEITPGTPELIHRLKSMIEVISVMLDQLSQKKEVEMHAGNVRYIKMEADLMLLVLLGEVYERETTSTGDLLEIIKWSHIYDRIEESLENAAVLANVIEGITLKNA